MEARGLDPVPDSERTGRVATLFPAWAAAKLGTDHSRLHAPSAADRVGPVAGRGDGGRCGARGSAAGGDGRVTAVAAPDLAVSNDPVASIGALPYLPTAVVGIALIHAMSMYSAGFTAQARGFASPRT
ncbi:hypothetical protein [Streptomyces sp. NPDC051286]|uniref:hypothetical protein n=1 Tax=Streptomyces sp. NPDC051286 TaxID=3365647 RepID=UPI0037A23FEF